MSVSELEALELHYKRQDGLSDLYYFGRDVLGYTDMCEKPHKAMCEAVIGGGKRQLHLWPRGHFKSSVITVGYTLQRIMANPNIRILIVNATLQNAKSFLREIKGHLERNDELRRMFGDHVSKDEKWTETEIISKQRTANLKEPTIQVAGVGQTLTSQHYDLIILDDIVSQETITTREQLRKTSDYYRLLLSLLDPTGEIVIIGTRYHFADLYGEIIATSDRNGYTVNERRAIEAGEILFPSRFTKAVLDDLRASQGSYHFSCQYMNMPVDDETAKFKLSNFRYYKPEELKIQKTFNTMCIDRAYSLAKTADFTGITIRLVNEAKFWFIPFARRLRITEKELIDLIFDLKAQYKIDAIGVEQLAFDNTLRPVLEEEMRRRSVFFRVQTIKAKGSKESRIESLVPRYESHSIFHLENECTDLEDELLRFPAAEHDDLSDSLAMHHQIEGSVSPQNSSYIKSYLQQEGQHSWYQ